MRASAGRNWLLILAALLAVTSARGQEPIPPALLPPATFAVRIAAQRLTPAPFDPAAQVVTTVAEKSSWPEAVQPPVPAFSLQGEYERSMTTTWEGSVAMVPFAFRQRAPFAAAAVWRPRHSLGDE